MFRRLPIAHAKIKWDNTSRNRKTSDPHRLLLNLTDKITLKKY